jgi:PncC family amidohydrolase
MIEKPLEVIVGELLRVGGWSLAVAESCTGGLVGHRLTNVPGSSDYFWGGAIAYANEAKRYLLGVQEETLDAYGAVSRQTALEMARGIRQALSVDIGLSVTGIAGPSGGTPEKPVGLTWIGLSATSGEDAWQHIWHGGRIFNKQHSAQAALQHLIDFLQALVPSAPATGVSKT